jgi:hypothetical protein
MSPKKHLPLIKLFNEHCMVWNSVLPFRPYTIAKFKKSPLMGKITKQMAFHKYWTLKP